MTDTSTLDKPRIPPDEFASLPIHPRPSIARWVSYIVAAVALAAVLHFLAFNDRWHWDLIGSYLFSERVMRGLLHTVELTLLTTVLGLVLGVITAWCRLSTLRVLRSFALTYIWIMRATPPLVMLLFVFFFGALVPNLSLGIPFGPSLGGLPTNHLITRFGAALIGLSIYLGAYSAEIFRGGVLALPAGQIEACKSLGLAPLSAYTRILGPQLVRVITPALANEIITIFKSTSLVSIIGYTELLSTVQSIYAVNFETIQLLTVSVIWYLALTSFAMFGQSRLEKRFGRGFTRRDSTQPRRPAEVVAPIEVQP